MSISSNVTEQDFIILRKLAEEQKNQRALKPKNRILKQTLGIKLADTLSPITIKFDEVNETTQSLEEIFTEKQPDNSPQLAVENTPIH